MMNTHQNPVCHLNSLDAKERETYFLWSVKDGVDLENEV